MTHSVKISHDEIVEILKKHIAETGENIVGEPFFTMVEDCGHDDPEADENAYCEEIMVYFEAEVEGKNDRTGKK